MRVVVDTNVFVSAVLKDSSFPAMALRLVERRGVLLKSEATEFQLFEVLARPYVADLVSGESLAWIQKLMAGAETVRVTRRIEACRDPTDDKFLELAVSGRAELIVSGDADLLALHPFRDIPIIAP
jgi:putative PIN family toxin of toxin-antitoxin system